MQMIRPVMLVDGQEEGGREKGRGGVMAGWGRLCFRWDMMAQPGAVPFCPIFF